MENVTLELANKMYLAKGLELSEEYRKLSSGTFRSEADELDVTRPKEAARAVNDWVKDKTHQKIDSILKEGSLPATP